ncbi:MAG: hypothetical protein GC204_12110 [Chloroflexi bacterium]|nr:hypothetical protein [Chloroflexota bacterium]
MTTTQIPTTAPVARPAAARRAMTTRTRLLLLGAVGIVLVLITLLQALNAYSVSYELFRNLIEVNSTTVDASESALQDIAQVSQAAADYAVLTSDTPLYEQSQNNIFRDFSSFRDEMFILRSNLQSDEERTAFTTADTFAYSSFWRHVSDLVSQRSDDTVARQQYLDADNHVRTWINPALQRLENLNFEQMVVAGNQAGSTIIAQVVLLAIPAVALAILLTYLSFMLRRKVHRYLTPGIDIAVVLSWVILLLMLINLVNAPNQLNTMIQDSYRSVSASSRVLVDANLANRAESSQLLDPERADAWNTLFDNEAQLVELRMCGAVNCTQTSFISGSSDQPSSTVVNAANNITTDNSAKIEGIVPLIANVTFSGETQALEQARVAFQQFLAVNTQLRGLVQANNMTDAVTLNTSSDPGTSQDTFNQFVTAINQVRDINHAVFDDVGQAATQTLQSNRILFGLFGYIAIGILLVVGVYHRYREL